MQFLLRQDIDTKKWDARIAESPIENIFCYSWYLDSVSKNWGAFVEGDYETIIPLPYATKLGIKSLYQPPFTRELDIFGETIQWDELLHRFSKIFRAIHFRNSKAEIISRFDPRIHQYLDLNAESSYSTNAKRLIKKANEHFEYLSASKPKNLLELFVETTFQKIDSISKDDLISLEKLMKIALKNGKGELIEVEKEGVTVAAGFFFKDKSRVTYLKGASLAEDKKLGAMFGLIDFAINKYRDEEFTTFDFGGSNIESVATFYKKFGANDRTYYDYSIDNLPLWFKTLKKIKR